MAPQLLDGASAFGPSVSPHGASLSAASEESNAALGVGRRRTTFHMHPDADDAAVEEEDEEDVQHFDQVVQRSRSQLRSAQSAAAAVARKPKPHSSAWQQQTLPSVRPRLGLRTTVICLLLVVLTFLPMGAVILVASDQVIEVNVRYDHYNKYQYHGPSNARIVNFTAASAISGQGSMVRVVFTVPRTIPKPAYMYYALTRFYQNHRNYRESRNDLQLLGENIGRVDADTCTPILGPGDIFEKTKATPIRIGLGHTTYDKMLYSPCGLQAWSMFNDSVMLYHAGPLGTDFSVPPESQGPAARLPLHATPSVSGRLRVFCNVSDFDQHGNRLVLSEAQNPCEKRGLTWPSERGGKFRPLSIHPTNWMRGYQHGTDDPFLSNGWYASEPGHSLPDALDEDFIVWMRTASLSDFRKPLRRFSEAVQPGVYVLEVVEFFDASSYGGTKSIVFASVPWVGGNDVFLGAAYLFVGGASLVLVVALTVRKVVVEARDKARRRERDEHRAAEAAAATTIQPKVDVRRLAGAPQPESDQLAGGSSMVGAGRLGSPTNHLPTSPARVPRPQR